MQPVDSKKEKIKCHIRNYEYYVKNYFYLQSNILFHRGPHQRRVGIYQQLLRRLGMPLITGQHCRSIERAPPYYTVQNVGRVSVERTILFRWWSRTAIVQQRRRRLCPTVIVVPICVASVCCRTWKTETHSISWLQHWIV